MKRNSKDFFDEISGKAFDNLVVLRLLPYLRGHYLAISACLVLVVLSAVTALAAPKILGLIVDKALLPKNKDLLIKYGLIFLGLEVVRLLAIYGQSLGLQRVGQSVMQKVRGDLFGRLIRMPMPFFDKHPVGKLVTRVTNDTANLSELFSASFVMLLSDILLIVGVLAAMIAFHAKLALISLSVFPLMMLAMFLFSHSLRLAFRRSRDVLARLNASFAERVGGMTIVQLMEREKREQEKFRALSKDYREKQFAGVYLYSLFHPTITILSGFSVVFVVVFGPRYLETGEIKLGTFVSFLAYVQILYQPVRNITDRYNIFLAAMSSAERIFSLIDMDEEAELRETNTNADGRNLPGHVTFECVSFAYETEGKRVPALTDLSFELPAGKTTAIVGHTGAGKTTVTSLLFRFYEPSSGRILLEGKSLSSYPKKFLRERIGFVQQEVFLFSGSIRENLLLLKPGISDATILDACARSGFARVLARLPRGLDSYLDERGTNLSLGERQLLAFTRVMLQDPDILILDEATASIDRETERQVQLATREAIHGKTSIVIAHRLETVRNADQILVLERGRLIEKGNHHELLSHGGVYANFVRLQSATETGGRA